MWGFCRFVKNIGNSENKMEYNRYYYYIFSLIYLGLNKLFNFFITITNNNEYVYFLKKKKINKIKYLPVH